MNNNEEKYCYEKIRAEKEYANNVTEDAIYEKLFIATTSNQEHDIKNASWIPVPHNIC